MQEDGSCWLVWRLSEKLGTAGAGFLRGFAGAGCGPGGAPPSCLRACGAVVFPVASLAALPCCAALLGLCGFLGWGGVSPVTVDFINPEAPWPALLAPRG